VEQKSVVFRRVNGRIVPIKVTRDEKIKGYLKSADMAVAGTLATGIGGAVAKFSMKKSKELQEFARKSSVAADEFTQLGKRFSFKSKFYKAQAILQRQNAAKARLRASSLKTFSKASLVSGSFFGGFLLGKGVQEAVEAKTGKDLSILPELGIYAGSSAATAAYLAGKGRTFKQLNRVAKVLRKGLQIF
jgi:hypothetical protein